MGITDGGAAVSEYVRQQGWFPVSVVWGPDDGVFVRLADICDILKEVAATEETDAKTRLGQLVANLTVSQGGLVRTDKTEVAVQIPPVNTRYRDMLVAAEQYYKVLACGPAKGESVQDYRDRVDRLIEPYSDDAAYTAFLRSERDARTAKYGTEKEAKETSDACDSFGRSCRCRA